MKRRKNNLLLLLLLSISFCFGQVREKNQTAQNQNLILVVGIENYVDSKSYFIKFNFINKSNDIITIAWSDANIFLSDSSLPMLSIYMVSKKDTQIYTYVVRSNENRLDFDKRYDIFSIQPKDTLMRTIDIKHFFGNAIPIHNMIFARYENLKEQYEGTKVFCGKLVSNIIHPKEKEK